MSGKLQKDLVDVNITCENGIHHFTVTHYKDYGYFGKNNPSSDVTDEFYSSKYMLSNVSVDENQIAYEKYYKTQITTDENGNVTETSVLDVERTEKSRLDAIKDYKLRKLNEQKKEHAASVIGVPLSTYTMPYYFNKDSIIRESKTYSFTPVGMFFIETDDNKLYNILVCVNITDSPCASSDEYGYDVPSSYYLNITE